jgi:hypothetical protein
MRLFILTLSVACVAAYGCALAGYGGYSFGKGRPDYIAWGLVVGTLCGAAAMKLWKKWLKEAAPDLLIFGLEGLFMADECPVGERPLGLPVALYAGQPQDLEALCGSAGAKNPFFFGSTPADKEAWLALGKGVFVAIGPGLADDPSPAWNSLHFDTLEEALSALLPSGS